MARYLYQLNKKKTVVIDEEAAKLCPELAKVNSKQLLFIVLYCDYNSPYHQLTEKERMLRAKRQVWGSSEETPELLKEVQEAMNAYMSLQYDPRRAQLSNYREKMTNLSNDMLNESDPRKIGLLDDAIEVLQKRAEKIEKELNEMNMVEQELKGGQTLSLLEKWQKNQLEYNKTRQRQEA